jgi:hypothetical protein
MSNPTETKMKDGSKNGNYEGKAQELLLGDGVEKHIFPQRLVQGVYKEFLAKYAPPLLHRVYTLREFFNLQKYNFLRFGTQN